MLNGGNPQSNCSRDVNGATVLSPKHNGASINSAAASYQQSDKKSNCSSGYSEGEMHEMCKYGKNVSNPGQRSSGDDAVVLAATTTASRPSPRIPTDGEEESVVFHDATTSPQTDTFMNKIRHFLLNNDPLLCASLKWGLAALLLLILALVVFGMLYSGVHYSSNCNSVTNLTAAEGMPEWCHTRFGTILGTFENTYAYSNCNDDYVSLKDAYMNITVALFNARTGVLTLTSKEFYTGLSWQCVEYARRYWMLNGRPKPAYFGSVDGAADIWNLTEVHLLENTSQTLPLKRYKSGDRVVKDGLSPPQSGDIIIYPIQPGGFPVGHVAVITKVEMAEHGCIYVAEQNWGSKQWPGPYHNYSRKIPLRYDSSTTAITLNDPAGTIIGWMRYG